MLVLLAFELCLSQKQVVRREPVRLEMGSARLKPRFNPSHYREMQSGEAMANEGSTRSDIGWGSPRTKVILPVIFAPPPRDRLCG